ncbi:uncharacterized protein LOC134448265 [Engraulis encrasicolus]|uniref:uncharacterized protein LOC134448265 n=1 Tax=Engraulis encrasicolus TaxID=184585 RepID=UPI002FD44D04
MANPRSVLFFSQVLITLVVVLLGILDAAPLQTQPECKGYIQHGGNVTYILPDNFPDLMANCEEAEILIGEKVSAIFENGKVPIELIPPVVAVTAHNFTLSSNQSSYPQPVDIGLYCLQSHTRISCFCDACINSVKNDSTISEPPIDEQSVSGTPDNSSTHYRVGAICAGVGMMIITLVGAFAWIVLRWRNSIEKKTEDVEYPLRDSSAETSASSSTEHLPGSQGLIETAPIMDHNNQEGI